MKPLVSVIIPYYNRPGKLLRALQSVMAQDYRPIEVIVVDDASTIPPEGLEQFSSLLHIKNSQNKGPGLSRNAGMQKATGSYLAFLDCDDYWAPEFLSECHNTFEKTEESIVFVYANSHHVKETKIIGLRHGKIVDNTTIIPDVLISGRPWCTSACLWNRALLNNQQWIAARTWEDYAFDIQAAVQVNRVGVVKKPLVYYEVGGSDKLSEQSRAVNEKEKATSLLYISTTLYNSRFRKDPFIRYKMQALLLARVIYKLRSGDEVSVDGALFKEYAQYGKKWKTSFMRILLKTNRAAAIKFLEKQKISATIKADQHR
jgi:glycosyltransferase involved in cell wall biosynthesis